MNPVENIRDIFSILHDGGIINWKGDNNKLSLTIDCQYLAERIDKSFDTFFIDIYHVDRIELDAWIIPIELPKRILTNFEDIFKAELEILSAEIKDDFVVVSCNQHDTSFDFVGGNLTIKAGGIKIYDQNRNELTIDKLAEICNNYWDEWSKK